MVKKTKDQYKRMALGYLLAASRTTDKKKIAMLINKSLRARKLSGGKKAKKRKVHFV